jgi:hypothetical protein
MAVAATVGGATSGLALARWDYSTLALLGTAAAAALLVGLALASVASGATRSRSQVSRT